MIIAGKITAAVAMVMAVATIAQAREEQAFASLDDLAWIPMNPSGPNKTGRKHLDSPCGFSAPVRIHLLRIG